MTLADAAIGRDNNYNFVRHLAAASVIFTHTYGLTGNSEPIRQFAGKSLGTFAVEIFFVLSGFLITASWSRNPDLTRFVKARLLRIFPALWVSVLLCLFVVGPLYTQYTLSDYFRDRSFFIFAAENLTLLPKGVYMTLPGVFTSLKHAAVNESLWTLPYELKMYIAVLICGIVGLLRLRVLILAAYLALTVGYLAQSVYDIQLVADQELLRLASFFIAGVVYFLFREKIILNALLAFAMFLLSCASFRYSTSLGTLIITLTLPYVVFCLVYLMRGGTLYFNKLGDYSYGLYVYAYPVQQILVVHSFTGIALHMGLSYLLTLLLAILSWHFVEKRAIGLIRHERSIPRKLGQASTNGA